MNYRPSQCKCNGRGPGFWHALDPPVCQGTDRVLGGGLLQGARRMRVPRGRTPAQARLGHGRDCSYVCGLVDVPHVEVHVPVKGVPTVLASRQKCESHCLGVAPEGSAHHCNHVAGIVIPITPARVIASTGTRSLTQPHNWYPVSHSRTQTSTSHGRRMSSTSKKSPLRLQQTTPRPAHGTSCDQCSIPDPTATRCRSEHPGGG